MSDAPKSIDDVCERLDSVQHRINESSTLHDRALWVGAYEKNLSLLHQKIDGFRDITRYVGYKLWYEACIDLEERHR